MKPADVLAPLEPLISLCNRCGTCQSVCPTYAVSGSEADVARGRIRTVRQVLDGRYDSVLGEGIPGQVDQCLLCGACTVNCPSSVPTQNILREVRTLLLSQKGFSLFHSLVYRGVLDRQDRLEKIISLVRLLDRGGLRNQVACRAAQRALPMVQRLATALPKDLGVPARKQLFPKVQPTRNYGGILYFMGCGTNVFTPGAGVAVTELLGALGFSVSVPEVPCCGGPHISAGDLSKARRLARENIRIMAAMDPLIILTDCATCSHTLHQYDTLFAPDDPIQTPLAGLKEKMVDLHGFLIDHMTRELGDLVRKYPAKPGRIAIGRPGPGRKLRVTYHDPCHAVRGMKVAKTPRVLLSKLPGMELVEMDHPDTCCGGAGSYSFRHPEISQKILDRKIDDISRTGAEVVATSCPSCALQIAAGLWRRNLSVRVAHPVELAAQALGIVIQ